jgi:hypothetical protein
MKAKYYKLLQRIGMEVDCEETGDGIGMVVKLRDHEIIYT